ncbi:hypothetical protein LY01_01402 [Nonlabens xylanidelens]|uniref:TIR domain-containing protein n=1 Tax=Nonlabens xylanidelens TaxID=191564 RepID=A0A2S6INL3_9FLAO|nr:hypothetical protein [Nonlabens xylanidelens]PPK95809.1 hypothetical protein LY01_01402 [Nonlabens xylanidelens]PQJ22595.1 hypothetical protein BST94_03215 [Nonlabens xylanidelens]
MINVFISHPTPYNEQQDNFLSLINLELDKHELNPTNLGKNNWNFQSPLKPIKEIMDTCKAAIVIGLERHHSFIGYEKEFSEDSKEFIHKYSSSPWIQIEAGMAYQADLPILILKESKVYGEGILDPQTSGSFVFEFDLKKLQKELTPELQELILSWVKHIKNLK